MQKTFYTDRPVTIKVGVSPGYITFHFKNEDDREFYWIGIEEWKTDFNNFHEHMLRKKWYTTEMEEFIDKSVGIK